MTKYLKIVFSLCVVFLIHFLLIKNVLVSADTHTHVYDNGICECGAYEEAGWDQTVHGGWTVGNAGQLLWIIDKQNSGTLKNRIVITKDITIPANISYVPLGNAEYPFYVDIKTYDNEIRTINLNNQTITKSNYGFIGFAKGSSTDKVLIQNIKITGNFNVTSTCENIAGVIGLAENNVELKNVTSDVTINVLENGVGSSNIGGIIGKGVGNVNIEGCSNFGTLNLDGVYSYVGGIIGSMETGYINSSANYADITANNAKYVGGILGYVDNESFNGITSTLNVGKITGKTFEITENEKQYTMTPGEIVGYLGKHVTSSVYANYTLGENAFGVIIDEALNPVSITSNKEELASGKIAYLLGSMFGQKIDNLKEEETKDAYPLVGATPVYQVTACDGTTIKYSNLNENDAHEYIYHKDGNVIYETCNICDHNKKLELLSPSDPHYDKTIKAARLSTDIDGLDVNSIEIKYDREVLFPGTYTASITYQGLTITHEFEILKGIPKVEMFTYHEPGELVYDGNNKYLDLYSTKEPGMGQVVVKYSRDNKKLDNICDAGLYLVVLSVEEGTYYEACEFSTLDNFKQVTIKPKEITVEWTKTIVFQEENSEYNSYTPEYLLKGICYNESVIVQFSNVASSVGTYTTTINILNSNYVLVGDNLTVEFTVKKILVDAPTIPYAIYKEGQLQKPEVSDTKYYKVVKNDGGKSYGRYPVVLELLEPEKYTWETTDDKQLTVFFFIYITQGQWITYPSIEDWTYGEAPILPKYKVNTSDLNIYLTYRHINGEFTTTVPTEVGSYEVRLRSEINDARVAPIEDVILPFEIKKADPICQIDSVFSINYGTKLSDIDLIGFGDGTWSFKDDPSTLLDAGTYQMEVIFTPINPKCYNTISKTVTINVASLETKYLSPSKVQGLVYNSDYQALITPGNVVDGTMYYKVEGSEWSKEIPYVKDAGTYTVYYKVVGNKNYADVEEKSFIVTVEKATLTLTADSFTIEQFTALPSFTYVADITNVTDLTPVMTVSITDTNTVGEYDITILEIDNPNYNITYVNGTLTITKHTECRGGTATCTKKAECVLCKEEYGEKAQHSFNDYKYNNDATSSSNGTVTSKCEHCDETNTILLENTMLPSGGENNNPGLGDNNSKPKNKLGLGICIGSISMLLLGAALYFFVLRKKK